MKIQINSLAALERLIGGDNQLEFDIRQSVVNAFTKKYLKGIATEEILIRQRRAILTHIEDEMITRESWGKAKVRPKYKEKFEAEIMSQFEGLIKSTVAESLSNSGLIKELVNENLEKLVKSSVNLIAKSEIKELAKKMIQDKFK